MMITVNVNKIMEYYVVGLVRILRFHILSVNPISCHPGLIIQLQFNQYLNNFESWTALGSRGCREKKGQEQASDTCSDTVDTHFFKTQNKTKIGSVLFLPCC